MLAHSNLPARGVTIRMIQCIVSEPDPSHGEEVHVGSGHVLTSAIMCG